MTELMTLSMAYDRADAKTQYLVRTMLGITPEQTNNTLIDLRTAKYFVYFFNGFTNEVIAICSNKTDAEAVIASRKAEDKEEMDEIIARGGPALDQLEYLTQYGYEIRIHMISALEF